MRARFALRVLILLLIVATLPVAFVRATHSPTVEQVVAVAESVPTGLVCDPAGATQLCVDPTGLPFRRVEVSPDSGSLSNVTTRVEAFQGGPYLIGGPDRDWIALIHSVGCVDMDGVYKFVDGMVAAFNQPVPPASYGPLPVGECSMTGVLVVGLRVGCQYPTCYWQVSGAPTSGAFPTPAPTPTPPPPVVTPTPTPTPSPTPTPTPSPSRTPRPTPTARPSATPEQTVAGLTFGPEPTIVPLDVSAPDQAGWASSVPSMADVSLDPAAIGASALLALLLLVFMGFVAELFNNTIKANYDVLVGWWERSGIGRVLRK